MKRSHLCLIGIGAVSILALVIGCSNMIDAPDPSKPLVNSSDYVSGEDFFPWFQESSLKVEHPEGSYIIFGEKNSLGVTLDKGKEIDLVVTDKDGQPVSVQLTPTSATQSVIAIEKLRLTGLNPGVTNVVLSAEGYTDFTLEICVPRPLPVELLNKSVDYGWWKKQIENDSDIPPDERENMLHLYDLILQKSGNIYPGDDQNVRLPPGKTLTRKQIDYVHTAVQLDHPELFWLANSAINFSALYIEGSSYLCDGLTMKIPSLGTTEEEVNASIENVEEATTNFISGLNISTESTSDQILRSIYKNLCTQVTYQPLQGKLSGGAWQLHCLYGSLVDKSCVCDGYGSAFSYIVKRLQHNQNLLQDVFCSLILGCPTGNKTGDSPGHAWNLVRVNDEWSEIDVTFADDHLSIDCSDRLTGFCSHNYRQTRDRVFVLAHRLDTNSICARYTPTAAQRLIDFNNYMGRSSLPTNF